MSVSFGDFVRRAREQAGLTQSRLAQLIGKSPTTIRSWEHGRTNPSDAGAVTAMAAVLGLDENDLLGQAGFEEAEPATGSSARRQLTSLASEPDPSFRLSVAPLVTDEPEHPSDKDQTPISDTPIGTAAPAAVKAVTIFTSPVPAAPSAEPNVETRDVPGPKTRIVVTQSTPGTSVGSSNGYVGALSYVEDDTEKDFYRRRGAITVVVLIFMVIVIWWALGRTGAAIADLIEGIVGSLDI